MAWEYHVRHDIHMQGSVVLTKTCYVMQWNVDQVMLGVNNNVKQL